MIRTLSYMMAFACSLTFATPPEAIIETDHFTIHSDRAMTYTEASQIGRTAEATFRAVRALPFSIANRDEDQPYSVRLVDKPLQLRHYAHEGFRNAAGIYLLGEDTSLVHIDSHQCADEEHRTLMHEITHQLQQDWLETLPVWLSEGLAVYISAHPITNGSLESGPVPLSDSPELERFIWKEIHIVELEALLSVDRLSWNALFANYPDGIDCYYLTAYLLTHYLFNMSEKDVTKNFPERPEATAPDEINRQILANRAPHELQDSLIAAFAAEGYTLIPMQGHVRNRRTTANQTIDL